MNGVAVLYVALGGALGSVARYLVQAALTAVVPTFPLGTLVVNVVGSFAIGVILPIVDKFGPQARPFLVVGVLGGLTTMSSFAADVTLLIAEKRYLAASLNWVSGAAVTIAACTVGMALVQR